MQVANLIAALASADGAAVEEGLLVAVWLLDVLVLPRCATPPDEPPQAASSSALASNPAAAAAVRGIAILRTRSS
jgi:hypothetical protein